MTVSRTPGLWLTVLLTALLAWTSHPGFASTKPASASVVESPTTRLAMKVKGCQGCKVQPVQNSDGTLSYAGKTKRVRDGSVRFTVPSSRTQQMVFLVYAPFDEYARQGLPMVVITGFKEKDPGSRVSDRFARATHKASGCWAGTTADAWTSTLVVKKRRAVGPYGEGIVTVAAGYLRRTEPSLRYWWRIEKSVYHASDPSICA